MKLILDGNVGDVLNGASSIEVEHRDDGRYDVIFRGADHKQIGAVHDLEERPLMRLHEGLDPLVTPVPNLNGNSKEDLLAQLSDLHTEVGDLIKVVRAASDVWHGRNFQTFGERGYRMQREAQDAWHQRLHWLTQFEMEIEHMQVEINDHV